MGVFDRIVCGVDESRESLEGVRQASRLRTPDGTLAVLAVAETAVAVHGGWDAARLTESIEQKAQAALERALHEAGPAHGRVVEGAAADALREEIDRERATLVAVGTLGHGRASGVALGRVSTKVLREAPCSVLIARAAPDVDGFPSAIAVGSDGSQHGNAAQEVAREIGARFGAEIREFVEVAKPVDELVAASEHADLLVVGSRGLRGLRALGSVSERVAHRAACSVLVVR